MNLWTEVNSGIREEKMSCIFHDDTSGDIRGDYTIIVIEKTM